MPDKPLQPPGPGRPKDLTKRRAILDAAKNLFLRNGYDGSSMDAIATEAGVSKFTVYSHFTDKETLFSAAIKAKCEEQLPELLFELPDNVPLESQLLSIARGFLALVNSRESVEMHRMMVSLASQNSKLSQFFYNVGPKRVQEEMEVLLHKAARRGLLNLDDSHRAADHFFSLLMGGAHFRLLIGCGEPLEGDAAELHVQDAIKLFLRAYRPQCRAPLSCAPIN